MSKRRILNVSSKKKRDTMIWANATSGAGQYRHKLSATGGSLNAYSVYVWCPTYRIGKGSNAESIRNAKTVFYRGLSEKMTVTASTSTPWKWRRIVFVTKALYDFIPNLVSDIETSAGWSRAMVNLSGDSATPVRNQLEGFLFEGSGGQDWWSPFTAKVDRKRVTLLYDKTRMLQSGNDVAHYHSHKQWIPINKNLVYDDAEVGSDESSFKYSVTSKMGFGDVYILDLFECASGNSADLLQFEPQATTYWHER